MNQKYAFALLCLLLVSYPARAQDGPFFESDRTQNTLVELYTSDASPECNQALKWMSSLKEKGPELLWKSFVPLQMHVSFWDGGGFKDPFAQKTFDDFLLSYKRSWKMRYVYAPTMVVNGTEWSGWSREQDIPRGLPEEVGVLSADGTKREGHFWVEFVPSRKININGLTVHAALLGFGVKSMPAEGDNRGRPLEHDFIVLTHQQQSFRVSNGLLTADFEINGKKAVKAVKYAVAFWVTPQDGTRPLQATGGFIQL